MPPQPKPAIPVAATAAPVEVVPAKKPDEAPPVLQATPPAVKKAAPAKAKVWTKVDQALLDHSALQETRKSGLAYSGNLEARSLGKTRVLAKSKVGVRNKDLHRNIFLRMTGNETRSATKHQIAEKTALKGVNYHIAHGMGHGQGGHKTQSPRNLASASEGADKEMSYSDTAISGNTDVSVDTRLMVRPKTQRAERVSMAYYHDEDPKVPFYQNTIDGDRPPVSAAENTRLIKDASWMSDPEKLKAAVIKKRDTRQALHKDLAEHFAVKAKPAVSVSSPPVAVTAPVEPKT
jgi:hypothetical protein